MNADQIRVHLRSSAAKKSRLTNLVGRTYAAWRKWTTSIIGGDFTVPHGERQTISLGVSLLHVRDASRIPFQHSHLAGGCILHPISTSLSVRLSEHDVALRDRLFHLVRLFRQIDISNTAGKSIGPLLDINVAFVVNRAIGIGVEHCIGRCEHWRRAFTTSFGVVYRG